jgi:hypothetical protein
VNTGQMLLVIGALALLSTIVLSVNRTLLDSDQMTVQTQGEVMAVSLARTRLNDLAAGGFTALNTGVRVDTLNSSYAAFVCTTRVDYVNAAAPDSQVVAVTRLKRVRVSLVNRFMPGRVSLRTVVGEY